MTDIFNTAAVKARGLRIPFQPGCSFEAEIRQSS